MTIQPQDDQRLNRLKKNLGLKTKIEVVRKALDSLEEQVKKQEQARIIARAVKLCARESARVNREFHNNTLVSKW